MNDAKLAMQGCRCPLAESNRFPGCADLDYSRALILLKLYKSQVWRDLVQHITKEQKHEDSKHPWSRRV